VDIYVHTIITPMNNRNNFNSTGSNNVANNSNSNNNEILGDPSNFLNLLTNSRHTNSASNNSDSIFLNISNNNSQENNNLSSNPVPENNNIGNNNLSSNINTTQPEGNNLLGKKRQGDDIQEERMENIQIRGRSNTNNSNIIPDNTINNLNMSEEISHSHLTQPITAGSNIEVGVQSNTISNQTDQARNRIGSDDGSSYEIIVEEFYENENEAGLDEEDESQIE
jgi:hypothetical protein